MVDSKKLISLVEKYEKLIYDTADHIWAHPVSSAASDVYKRQDTR